jgi:general stress protein 26
MVVDLIQFTTMVVEHTVAAAFVAVAHRIVWCTVATVDRHGRPRSRILHPYWEHTEDGLKGWITTRPTPLKRAHLAHSPHVSCSYWDATQDAVVAECRASWVEDVEEKERAWDRFRSVPEPLGHDPYNIWPAGPSDPDAGVIELVPWRLRVASLETLMGRAPVLTWRAPDASPRRPQPAPLR